METLTDNAKKLYNFLLETNGAWEGRCLEAMFPKPKYPETNDKAARIAYWQWEADAYGTAIHRPVLALDGGKFEAIVFNPSVEKDFRTQLSEAYKLLRKNGLASEKNNGFNDYMFYPIKKK